MHYLVATDSVHTTAAACDYLDDRLDGPAADSVTVLTVPGDDSRDAGDAANVARARLAGRAALDVISREGPPADAVLAAADELGVDVLVLGPRSGDPDGGEGTDDEVDIGGTARAVLARTSRPVVVVPQDV